MSGKIEVGIKKIKGEVKFAEVDDHIESLQGIVNGDLDRLGMPNNIDLWVNDIGLIDGSKVNFFIYNEELQRFTHEIRGDVFFAGLDRGTLDTISLNDDQKKWIRSHLKKVLHIQSDGSPEMIHILEI